MDGDCSHKIKRCLLLRRKAIRNSDRVLNSRGITLTKGCLVKAMSFPVVIYRRERCSIKKKDWAPKNCCFWIVLLEKPLESSLDWRKIKPVSPKRNQSWIFHWKDWCWSWRSNISAILCEELIHWKRLQCWKKIEEKGVTEDDIGWHQWLSGHEFE